MAVGLGIIDGLSMSQSSKFYLKWPNDIIVDDLKLGGVLIEKYCARSNLEEEYYWYWLKCKSNKLQIFAKGNFLSFDWGEVFIA